MSPASPLLNAWKHLMSCPHFFLDIVLGLNVTYYKHTVTFSCGNSNFVGNKRFFPPHAFTKKPHHTILGVLHPASSLHIVLWYLHFMEKKIQPKMPTQFLHYQRYTRKVPLLSSQPIPVHSWMNNVRINMSYSALFIISLDLMLSRGVKVWCLLNVIHFLSLCILLAKRAPSLLFCYCCFRVILKIREILKLFQIIS